MSKFAFTSNINLFLLSKVSNKFPEIQHISEKLFSLVFSIIILLKILQELSCHFLKEGNFIMTDNYYIQQKIINKTSCWSFMEKTGFSACLHYKLIFKWCQTLGPTIKILTIQVFLISIYYLYSEGFDCSPHNLLCWSFYSQLFAFGARIFKDPKVQESGEKVIWKYSMEAYIYNQEMGNL